MANITSPSFSGGTIPQGATYLLVPTANTNPAPHSVIVYTSGILSAPTFDQIITVEDPPAVGYPTG